MDKIVISTGFSRFEKNWKTTKITAEELCAKLAQTIRTPETMAEYAALPKAQRDNIKDHGGFVGGKLRGGRRTVSTVEYRSLITLDLDTCPPGFQDKLRDVLHYDCFVYSTHSHTSAAPRYRLLFFLTRNISPDEYNAIAHYLAHDIGPDKVDPCSFRVHQLMYWPTTSADGEYYSRHYIGPTLDPDAFLATRPNWRDLTDLPPSERETASFTGERKKVADPFEKQNVVGLFCRAYGDIETVIDTFLPSVYRPSTTHPGRYDYVAGSSTAGAVIIDGKWLFSHHATDPAGGHMQNAFDLVRIHRFGKLDLGYEGPAEIAPSYREMEKLVLKDQRCLNLSRRERQASLQEDFGEPDKWEEKLVYTKQGSLAPSIINSVLILENHPDLQSLVFNELADNIELGANIPWHHDKFWRDVDDAHLNHWIAANYGELPTTVIRDAVDKVADDRHYHPIRDFLSALPDWDGVPRLDTLLIDLFGAEDSLYVRAVTRKTLVAAVRRVLQPGCKFDYVLTLVGPQGIGKSTAISTLCGPDYFTDNLSFNMMRDKASAENIQGNWIVELGEMAGVSKAEVESVKGFLSRQDDKYRASYGRRSTPHPRQCIFIGTANQEGGFLRDITGNRRFWVVPTPRRTDMILDSDYVRQVWAEAKVREEDGEALYLPQALEEAAEAHQLAAMEHDDREGLVGQYLETLLPENWDGMDLYRRLEYLHGDDPINPKGVVKRGSVCNMEIWCECYGRRKEDMQPRDSYAISAIMKHFPKWKRAGVKKIPLYGQQRMYVLEE